MICDDLGSLISLVIVSDGEWAKGRAGLIRRSGTGWGIACLWMQKEVYTNSDVASFYCLGPSIALAMANRQLRMTSTASEHTPCRW